MSKHKKRVSVAQRPSEQPRTDAPASDAPAAPSDADSVEPVESPAQDVMPVEMDATADQAHPGIESSPIFWFSLGALTVGIVVLIGLLLFTQPPKPAPVAPATTTRPTSTRAGSAQLPQPNFAATYTAVAAVTQGVPRVSIEETKRKLDAGQVIVVDVRAKELFDEKHIKGAINIPEVDTQKRLAELPKDRDIVFYCS
jgi:hypothetical protein